MTKNNYTGYRPTWAEIKLENLDHNLGQVKSNLARGVKVMVTVKADAYGHGLLPVAKRLVAQNVDYLGVASIDEGIILRKNGISVPILVLGMVLENDINPLFEYNLTPTVCTLDLAYALHKKAKARNKRINVHVKVDTGMGRIGLAPQDAQALVKDIARLRFINLDGLFTHFAFADLNKKFTRYQINLFQDLVTKLNQQGIEIPLVHSANSMGVIDYKEGHFNMVRPGLVIYGLYPREGIKLQLKPVLSLKTKVVYAKRTPKGSGISYGHIYITRKNTTIVTLPIGYGDGYPRNLSNIAPVLIGGRCFKISGRVCMDQVMVDVGNFPVKTGDEVVLIGTQKDMRVTTEELAKLSGTIPYEIVCGLGNRVPRVYSGEKSSRKARK